MLKLALLFFIISLIAGLFGFTGIAVATAGIAKVIFCIFLILFFIMIILALTITSSLSQKNKDGL